MLKIESITSRSSPELLEKARSLFRAYGEFLRDSGGPALFCFSRLDDEISDLPAAYADHGGEVLLATDGVQAAGCIAYRLLNASEPAGCEIKRLFVSSAFRGQGLGKRLVLAAVERARQNGYRAAYLDTDPGSMAVARQMYLDLGFTSDADRNSGAENSPVEYFKKLL